MESISCVVFVQNVYIYLSLQAWERSAMGATSVPTVSIMGGITQPTENYSLAVGLSRIWGFLQKQRRLVYVLVYVRISTSYLFYTF